MGKVPVPQVRNPEDPIEYCRAFVELVRILRRECPWDRKQTHETISYLLIEEAYETLEAIREHNDTELAKELGDLLLHVIMHSVIAEDRKAFTLSDVIAQEMEKLVARHPHVFGEVEVRTEEEVKQNWEQLKLKEKGRTSILEGVPKHLPALLRAHRIQEKVSRVGFDWQDARRAFAKVEEELQEVKAQLRQEDPEALRQEFGDLLFALVNVARLLGIVAEEALQQTNDRFIARFQYIEQQARQRGQTLQAMSLAEMDQLWEEAKQQLDR